MTTESPETVRGGAEYRRPVRDKARKEVEKKNVALEMLKIEYVSRHAIRPNDWNPNRQSEHDFELLVRSMREDGFTQPVIVLRDSKMIVDGEHRWRASGVVFGEDAEIPVVYVDMTPEQARIATLRHNRARGEEDIELSANLLKDLAQLGALEWAADSLMLDDSEIQRLLDDIPAPEALADDSYSEAWEPGEASDASRFESTPALSAPSAGARSDSMSETARNTIREQEQRLAQARSDEERQAIRRDTAVFRLTLLFSGEEGDLVRRVLGDSPAQTVLELCRERDAAGQPAGD